MPLVTLTYQVLDTCSRVASFPAANLIVPCVIPVTVRSGTTTSCPDRSRSGQTPFPRCAARESDLRRRIEPRHFAASGDNSVRLQDCVTVVAVQDPVAP